MSTDSPAAAALSPEVLDRLRRWLVEQVTQGLATNPAADPDSLLGEAFQRSRAELPAATRDQILYEVRDILLAFGPLETLLADDSVTEIMVNGPGLVYVERKGKVEKTSVQFPDEASLLSLIERIVTRLGRRVGEDSPTVDARLPDGSRVNAVIRPVAIDGPILTIRKFARERMQMEDLIRFGTLTPPAARFLEACVVARLNTIVSGGTGSGKTTLLNVLSGFIPANERIVTIEDSAELQLDQEHCVRLESQPPDIDGQGEVPIRHLVRNALRMRPDRIIVGEVRGGEALDMLQAMNTGHDGSLTTVHANSPRDAASRLETLTLLAGFDLPVRVIREQITSAVDLIVQQARLRDGSRKVVSVSEIQGMEGDIIVINEIFKFKETAIDGEGRVVGELTPTGMRPVFEPRLKAAGFSLPPEMFGAGLLDLKTGPARRSR